MSVAQELPFSISVVPDARRPVVALAGDLDMLSAGEVHDAVDELRRTGHEHVAIDLRDVAFMDSRGLQLLLVLRNDAKRREHVLTLVPGSDAVQRLFALTFTSALFDWA